MHLISLASHGGSDAKANKRIMQDYVMHYEKVDCTLNI